MIVRQLLPRVSRLSRGARGSHVVPSWQSEAERSIQAALSGENWRLYTEVGGKVLATEQRLAAKLDSLAGMETKMNGKIDQVEQRVNKLVEEKVTQAERMLQTELKAAMAKHTGKIIGGVSIALGIFNGLGIGVSISFDKLRKGHQ